MEEFNSHPIKELGGWGHVLLNAVSKWLSHLVNWGGKIYNGSIIQSSRNQ